MLLLPLASATQAANKVTYYYTDTQGTVLATADEAGNVTAVSDYRPYGVQALGTPEAAPGYTGHVNDPDSGFVYMQARYYDPIVGRFLGIDPKVVEPGHIRSYGRYTYANSNPVVNIDPDGRDSQVSLWMYSLNIPFNPGVGHSFVVVRNMDNNAISVARAGPDSDAYGNSAAILDSPQEANVGDPTKLVSLIASDIRSDATSSDAQNPGARLVEGTERVVKGDTQNLINKIGQFNDKVNQAQLPYMAQSQNSNSYAGTLYQDLTSKAPPATPLLPGITNDLTDQLCSGSEGCGK
jgi:RHS repeat-associated protein